MEGTVKLIKGNREISVFDFEVEEYLDKGYSFITENEKSRYEKRSTASENCTEKLAEAEEKIEGLCKQVEELTTVNKSLTEENEELNKELEELRSALAEKTSEDEEKGDGKKSSKGSK